MSSENNPAQREYHAFISYRHADNREPGRQWATWLHQAIETYEVPDDLVGKTNGRGEVIPPRIYPVFRDEEELPAHADLANSITGALRASRLLIILCSPNAVASSYVADEISYFKKLGHSDRIVAAMIAGEPNASWDKSKQAAGISAEEECFPIPLQFSVDEQGEICDQRAEPIAADFRVNIDGKTQQGWCSIEAYRQHLKVTTELGAAAIEAAVKSYAQQQQLMLLKIIAGILGVPLGELTQRDKEYQLLQARQKARRLRQWLSGVAVLAVLAVMAGVTAYWQQQKAIANEQIALKNEALAKEQRDQSLIGQSRSLLDQARQANERGEHDLALLLGLNALPGPYGDERPTPNALAELRRAIVDTEKQFYLHTEQDIVSAEFSPDGTMLLVVTKAEQARIYDIATGELKTNVGDAGELQAAHFSHNGQLLAQADRYGNLDVRNLETGTNQQLVEQPQGTPFEAIVFSHDDKTLFATNRWGQVSAWSLDSGELLFSHKVEKAIDTLVVSSDDSLLLGQVTFSSEITIWSAADGEVIRTFPDDDQMWLNNKKLPPEFMADETEAIMVHRPDGTYVYSLEDGSQQRPIPNAHVVFNDDMSYGILLHTYRAYSSDIENFDAIESLKKTPILLKADDNSSRLLSHMFDVERALFSADGRYVITIAFRTAYVWDLETGVQVNSFNIHDANNTVMAPVRNQMLSFESRARKLGIWQLDVSRGRTPVSAQWRFEDGGLSHGGRYALANNTGERTLHLLDTQSRENLFDLPDTCRLSYPQIGLPVISFSEDDTLLLIRCHDRNDILYSLTDQTEVDMFSDWTQIDSDIQSPDVLRQLSDDGRYLLNTFNDYQTEWFALVEAGGEAPVWVYSREYQDDQSFAGINPSSEYLYLYNQRNGNLEVIRRLDDHKLLSVEVEHPLVDLHFAGERIVLLDDRGRAMAYDLESGEQAWRYGDGVIYGLMAVHTDRELVALAASGGEMRWLSIATGDSQRRLSGSANPQRLRFIGDGRYLSVYGSTPLLLDTESGQPQYPAREYHEQGIALDTDADQLIITSNRGYIRRLPLLNNNIIEAAVDRLPVNRRCLNDTERDQFYLAPLSPAQRLARGCDQRQESKGGQ